MPPLKGAFTRAFDDGFRAFIQIPCASPVHAEKCTDLRDDRIAGNVHADHRFFAPLSARFSQVVLRLLSYPPWPAVGRRGVRDH